MPALCVLCSNACSNPPISPHTASPDHGGALSRMQSIRKSFRQSLKRFDVRRSMRGLQSTQRSFRPNLQRSGSTRPSMKNRAQGGIGGSTDVSVEATPLPPRRDIIKTINFTAPVNISGTAVIHLLYTVLPRVNAQCV